MESWPILFHGLQSHDPNNNVNSDSQLPAIILLLPVITKALGPLDILQSIPLIHYTDNII